MITWWQSDKEQHDPEISNWAWCILPIQTVHVVKLHSNHKMIWGFFFNDRSCFQTDDASFCHWTPWCVQRITELRLECWYILCDLLWSDIISLSKWQFCNRICRVRFGPLKLCHVRKHHTRVQVIEITVNLYFHNLHSLVHPTPTPLQLTSGKLRNGRKHWSSYEVERGNCNYCQLLKNVNMMVQ